ncbi:coiled-coil domain-containing protein 60 [Rhinatrema bivittatum]|uniref:coiled-coil domain-containing protein 60 n=1 Tax=Rhinatrema bivittatum TaxID=194408 RepID=UPI00112A5D0F|nr:coiled-coil domain-containing protein 60 [Rhinatrema bivittatum]XP_029427456.1 coiled-coil domain-containing protein 60 [Rhinatrema bivittatum]
MPGERNRGDLHSNLLIKPLTLPSQKELKIPARGATMYSCQKHSTEQACKANTQQGQQVVSYKPYQEFRQSLYLEAKNLFLHSLRQDAKDKESIVEEVKTEGVLKGSLEINSLKLIHREKHLKNFNKNLLHTRQLISAVRKGQGYFYLLQKEDEEKMTALLAEKQKLQEKKKMECQSPSEEDLGNEEEEEISMMDSNQTNFFHIESSLQKKPERKEQMTIRPFTPIYNSLFSDKPSDADPLALFRQLCALHWLLEALNLEFHNATTMTPVYTCWNEREPGGCRSTLKRINKEKAVELKWEQFVTPGKTKKILQKPVRSQFFLRRKASLMSISRFSGLSSTHTPTMGSMSSLIPSSEDGATGILTSSEGYREGEDNDSMASSSLILLKTSREHDEAVSDYLMKLRELIRVHAIRDLAAEDGFKKMKLAWVAPKLQNQDKICSPACEETESLKTQEQRCKRSPLNNDSATSLFIKGKSSMCLEMRHKFFEVADEAVLCLNKDMKVLEGRRRVLSAQKFNSLRTVTHFHKDLERMRKPFYLAKDDYTNSENWFFHLLSRIPDVVKKNPKIQKILSKLEKFGEIRYERVWSSTFLKVLCGLRTWELCSPDLSVAIEFVRENLIRMPEIDYTAWLHSRVILSNRSQSAPPMS